MPKKDKKNLLSVLVPLIVAVLVVVTLFASGRISNHVTTNVSTTVSVTDADSTTGVQTTKPRNTKVNIIAVGDNLIHMPIVNSGKAEDGSYDFNEIYDNISPYIKEADIAAINQETMLGGSSFDYSGYPCFNTPWEIGEAAINAGFDLFTCATNHSMDVGYAGIEKECEFFSKHPEVTHIGTYTSEEDYNTITYMTKNDIKFAMLNYTFGTNGIPVPSDKSYCVALLEKEKVTRDIKSARENADVVIVFPHWGEENSHEVNELQREYTALFSRLGVDIVIGTHPHVIQPVEWYTNEKTGKKMLVYYSIGNFLSRQTNNDQLCGGMAEITVERIDGKIKITNAKLAPVCDYYKYNGDGLKFSLYKLSDYTDDIARTSVMYDSGATPEYFTNMCKEIVSEEFLNLD